MQNIKRTTSPVIYLLVLMLGLFGCTTSEVDKSDEYTVPQEFESGKNKFVAMCSVCHGNWAEGTDVGPPLVDIVYEPSHHSDRLFLSAIDNGVTQHHWEFGDMPPIPGVSVEDALEMIAFIRWLQRENGIE